MSNIKHNLTLDQWIIEADNYLLRTHKVSITDIMDSSIIQDLYTPNMAGGKGLEPIEAIDYYLHNYTSPSISCCGITAMTEEELKAKHGATL